MKDVVAWADGNGKPVWALAEEIEGNGIRDHLSFVWQKMQESVLAGLVKEGCLPGGLKLQRTARSIMTQAQRLRKGETGQARFQLTRWLSRKTTRQAVFAPRRPAGRGVPLNPLSSQRSRS